MVEQKAVIQGIKMSRGIERVLITKQEIVILPKIEPIITQGVHVVIIIRYSEPRCN